MSDYVAPLRDMQFVLHELAGLDEIAALPGFGEATPDLVEQPGRSRSGFSRERPLARCPSVRRPAPGPARFEVRERSGRTARRRPEGPRLVVRPLRPRG